MLIAYHGRTYAEGKKIEWKKGIAALYYILRFRLFDWYGREMTSLGSFFQDRIPLLSCSSCTIPASEPRAVTGRAEFE